MAYYFRLTNLNNDEEIAVVVVLDSATIEDLTNQYGITTEDIGISIEEAANADEEPNP